VASPVAGIDAAQLSEDIILDLRSSVHAGPEWRVTFVDRIPPDPNGKLRVVVSHMAKASMDAPIAE
jgi:hypothetical protein